MTHKRIYLRSLSLIFRAVTFLAVLSFGADVLLAAEESKKKDLPTIDSYLKVNPEVETVADSLEYNRKEKKVIAKGNVVLRYKGTELTADYGEVETDSKKAYVRGHVIVFQEGIETTKAEEMFYDFENDTGMIPEARYVSPPWYNTGTDVKQIKKGHKEICDGSVTSCNMANPYYEIRAKKIDVYEGDKLVARNVTLYLFDKPVFWLPYLIIPLGDQSIPFQVTTGFNSRHGYYIEASKGISFTKELSGKLHADWRSKRGFGGGFDFNYNYGRNARGVVKTYWTQDDKAPIPGNIANPFAETEDRDRGRLHWSHRTDFDPDSHLILRYERLADEYFLQEFFEKEFRAEVEPQSFVTFTKNSDRYGFYAGMQKQMNGFERLVERLPEARFNWRNQPLVLGGIIPGAEKAPPLYYESELSFANLAKKRGRDNSEEDVVRADFFNEWSMPFKLDELKVMPFVNARGTYYSRELGRNDDKFRTAFGWGMDLRTHAYKIYDTSFDVMGIEVNQLRHVIEPSVRYESIVSSVSDETLAEFDSIDRIDDSHRVTFGLENRIQTKRVVNGKMQRVDFVSMNTYLSHEWNPDGRTESGLFPPFLDRTLTQSDWSILSQELVIRPYNWLQYELRLDYDTRRDELRYFTQDVIASTERFRFVFGHRYTNDIEDIEGGNQFVFNGNYTINPLWDIGGYIRWDNEDVGLQEWQVSAVRNLACDFVLEFGYNVRDSLLDDSNKTLFFNFYLEPQPGLAIRAGGSRASFGAPLIGETVAGANQNSSGMPYEFGKHDFFQPAAVQAS